MGGPGSTAPAFAGPVADRRPQRLLRHRERVFVLFRRIARLRHAKRLPTELHTPPKSSMVLDASGTVNFGSGSSPNSFRAPLTAFIRNTRVARWFSRNSAGTR